MTATDVIAGATLNVEQRCSKHPLYVSGLGHAMILGYYFLARAGAQWDFADRTIRSPPARETEVSSRSSWFLRAEDGLGSQLVQLQALPLGLMRNFTWAGCASSRQQVARERFRANPKNRAKHVLEGVPEAREKQRGEEPLQLIMPPPERLVKQGKLCKGREGQNKSRERRSCARAPRQERHQRNKGTQFRETEGDRRKTNLRVR